MQQGLDLLHVRVVNATLPQLGKVVENPCDEGLLVINLVPRALPVDGFGFLKLAREQVAVSLVGSNGGGSEFVRCER